MATLLETIAKAREAWAQTDQQLVLDIEGQTSSNGGLLVASSQPGADREEPKRRIHVFQRETTVIPTRS